MTPEELQEVVAAVIAALKTNGKTIDQLTAVTSLADTDNLEISNGKKVSFGKLKELVAAAVTVSAEEIKGWEMIESTEDLPEDPTQVQQEKAYVLADTSTMYVYVGYGGDTLSGKYKSIDMKGPKGNPGTPLGETEIVDDLESEDPEKVLSANQGRVLKGMIDSKTFDVVDDLTTGGRESALSAEQGKVLGNDVYGQQGKVSPNTAIASITGYNSLTSYQANNFTVNGLVAGVNINLRTGCTLEVVVYDVVAKAVVSSIKTETFSSGGVKSITFTTPVELGANQFIACKPSSSAIYLNSASGVGYYYNGTYVANKELSFELVTISKGLQAKVAELEAATAIVPTLKSDVVGDTTAYVSPVADITTTTSKFQSNNTYMANKLFSDKKILGIRLYCITAESNAVTVGLFDISTLTVTDLKSSITVAAGLNTILFDAPIYLKPSQIIAVKSSSYTIGYFTSGGSGLYRCSDGYLTAAYALAYELIVEDNGLIGDVAELEMIPTHKSWCSVGTSITYNNDGSILNAKPILKGYQNRVMEKISFTNFYNVGVSGQSAKGLANNIDTVLTAVADYYTVEHGINDWHNDVAVGTINDFINNTGSNTFYGAYRIIIDKIYSLNANAQIILITPRKAYGAGVFPEHWWEDINGIYLKDYVTAVKAIGEFMSLPVCDWFAESNTNQNNLAANSADNTPALHPNDTGYQKLANLLVQTFKKVID